MNKLLLSFALILLLSNCNNKEKALQEARKIAESIKKNAKLDSITKVIKEENLRLERMRDVRLIRKNSIDYDEPFTIYFGRKKLFVEEGDLKGFLSVSIGINNEGSFLHFPSEESRESFVNFIKYARKKQKEWHSVAVKNNVKEVDKVIMVDTTKYWMSTNKYGFDFTEEMTLTARYSFIQICERRDCANSSIYIDFNEADGFSKEGDFRSVWLMGLKNKDLDRTIDAFNTETINKFIKKANREKKLFE